MAKEFSHLLELLKNCSVFDYEQKWRSSDDLERAMSLAKDSSEYMDLLHWLEAAVEKHLSDEIQTKALKKIEFLKRFCIWTVITELPVRPKIFRCLLVTRIVEALLKGKPNTSQENFISGDGSGDATENLTEMLLKNFTEVKSNPQEKLEELKSKLRKGRDVKEDTQLEDSISSRTVQLLKFKYHCLEDALSLEPVRKAETDFLLEYYGIDWNNMDIAMLQAKCFGFAKNTLEKYSSEWHDDKNCLRHWLDTPGLVEALIETERFTVAVFKNKLDLSYGEYEHGLGFEDERHEIRLKKIESLLKEAGTFYLSIVEMLKATPSVQAFIKSKGLDLQTSH